MNWLSSHCILNAILSSNTKKFGKNGPKYSISFVCFQFFVVAIIINIKYKMLFEQTRCEENLLLFIYKLKETETSARYTT